MNRNELGERVLIALHRANVAAQVPPSPPKGHSRPWPWDVRAHELDVEFGPRYSPQWFGDLAATEAGRVRVLRTVYRLAVAGLLVLVKSEAGRLERVQLTAAGEEAVAGLTTEAGYAP